MKPTSFALILLALFLALFVGWTFYDDIRAYLSPSEVVKIRQAAEQTSQPGAEEGRTGRIPMPPRHPVSVLPGTNPAAQSQQLEPPLPQALDQADGYLRERLPQLIPDRRLQVLVNLNYFIQKLVLFIDHLPEKSLPRLHLPITPPEPGFITAASGEEEVIAKRNAARYTAYVALVEAIPEAPLLRLYRGLYPLFQQAYRETNGSHAHFNDRLVEVIDHLLQTPEPRGPVAVMRHVGRYRYVDDALESCSAGQKILLRMGLANARRVKERLQIIRQSLVRKDW